MPAVAVADVAGGPHAVYQPYELFSDNPADPKSADVAVTGEEFVLLSLIEVLLSIRDAAAAAEAARAGEAADVELELGTGEPGAYNERTRLRARVERLFDGEVVYTHPVNAGYRAVTGQAALLRAGGLQVVVHTRSVGVIDPALYVALGADRPRSRSCRRSRT